MSDKCRDGGFFLTVRARDRDFGEVSSHTRDLGRTPKPGETDTLVFSLPITFRATVTCYTLDTPLGAVYMDSAPVLYQAVEPQDTINLTLTIRWFA